MFDSHDENLQPAGDTPPLADADGAVAQIAAAVDALAGDDPAGLGWAEQREQLRALGRLVDRLEAQRIRLLHVADRSGALADDGAATAASWLRRHSTLTATQAAGRAKLARRLPDLPVIAGAFAVGDLGVSHVTQIDRLCRDVGVDQVAAVQAELVTAAGRLRDVGEFTRLCVGWRHALRPDLADAADDRAHDQRRLSHTPTFDGVFHLNGVFDAEAGATIAAAINAYMTHDPPGTPPELRRTVAQRRADAMYDIAKRALASPDAPDVAGSRPHVVARVNLTDLLAGLVSNPAHPDHHRLPGHRRPMAVLDWAGPVGPATLMRLLGDSSVTRIITNGASQPLDVGTATRVWPAAVRKAITDRDRGCRFEPCDRPGAWCDIDHVVPFCEGGATAVDNGILLCRHHHRAKRRDGWWPTLHPDGTVTWTHADGRTRSDPPPAVIDDHITALTNAAAAMTDATADHMDNAAADSGYRYVPTASDTDAGSSATSSCATGPMTASEAPATYHTAPSNDPHPPSWLRLPTAVTSQPCPGRNGVLRREDRLRWVEIDDICTEENWREGRSGVGVVSAQRQCASRHRLGRRRRTHKLRPSQALAAVGDAHRGLAGNGPAVPAKYNIVLGGSEVG